LTEAFFVTDFFIIVVKIVNEKCKNSFENGEKNWINENHWKK
jgi:hypothetical protein